MFYQPDWYLFVSLGMVFIIINPSASELACQSSAYFPAFYLTFQLSTQLSTLGVKLSGKLESLVEGSGELKHLSPTAAGQLVQIRIFLC